MLGRGDDLSSGLFSGSHRNCPDSKELNRLVFQFCVNERWFMSGRGADVVFVKYCPICGVRL